MYNEKLKVDEKNIKREEGIELLYEKIEFTKLKLSYSDIRSFSEGLVPVKNENGKYGYIDKSGNIVIPFKFEDALPFSEGLAPVKIGKGEYYVNKSGYMQVLENFEKGIRFSEGIVIQEEGKGNYIYIDKNGNIVTPFKFEDALPFSEGLALVNNENGKYECIDKTGKKVKIPNFYKKILSLGNNLFFLTDHDDKQYLMEYTLKKEKISNKELNTNDIEELKVLLSKIKNATQIKLYYDLIFNGKVLTFDTLEKRNQADGTGPDTVESLKKENFYLKKVKDQAQFQVVQLNKLIKKHGIENKQLKKNIPPRYY